MYAVRTFLFPSLSSGGCAPCDVSLCGADGYTTAAAGPKYHSLRHTARPVNNRVLQVGGGAKAGFLLSAPLFSPLLYVFSFTNGMFTRQKRNTFIMYAPMHVLMYTQMHVSMQILYTHDCVWIANHVLYILKYSYVPHGSLDVMLLKK